RRRPRQRLRGERLRRDGLVRAAVVEAGPRSVCTAQSKQRSRVVGRFLEALPEQCERTLVVVALADAGVVGGTLQQRRCRWRCRPRARRRSEEHTSELQSRENLVCRLLLEKKKYPMV